jgi:hypothetical protein
MNIFVAQTHMGDSLYTLTCLCDKAEGRPCAISVYVGVHVSMYVDSMYVSVHVSNVCMLILCQCACQ